jgi:hypothetical protein
MRFKDDDKGSKDPHVTGSSLPTEYPFGCIVEDMEHACSHMYVITRATIYRFDPVTFMSLMKRYAEGAVANDPENAPDLEKVRAATQALRGLVGTN